MIILGYKVVVLHSNYLLLRCCNEDKNASLVKMGLLVLISEARNICKFQGVRDYTLIERKDGHVQY